MRRILEKISIGDGCWDWLAYITPKGYGAIEMKRADGKFAPARAHRVVYEMMGGEIPAGMQLDHLCGNRKCVRPDHLEPVTNHENTLRGVNLKGTRTHCQNGHERTTENTYVHKGGWPQRCRICKNEASARTYRRARDAKQLVAA